MSLLLFPFFPSFSVFSVLSLPSLGMRFFPRILHSPDRVIPYLRTAEPINVLIAKEQSVMRTKRQLIIGTVLFVCCFALCATAYAQTAVKREAESTTTQNLEFGARGKIQ